MLFAYLKQYTVNLNKILLWFSYLLQLYTYEIKNRPQLRWQLTENCINSYTNLKSGRNAPNNSAEGVVESMVSGLKYKATHIKKYPTHYDKA